MKKYLKSNKTILYEIIYPALDRLIKKISEREKIMLHVWEQGIEKNWSEHPYKKVKSEVFLEAWAYSQNVRDNIKETTKKNTLKIKIFELQELYLKAIKDYPTLREDIIIELKNFHNILRKQLSEEFISEKVKQDLKKYKSHLKSFKTLEEEPLTEEEIPEEIGEETLEEPDEEETPEEKILRWDEKYLTKKNIIILIAVIILSFYFFNRAPPKADITNITQIENITAKRINQTSFEDYIKNKDVYDGQSKSLIGFLSRELIGTNVSGIYEEYILDGFGDKITLTITNPSQKKFFPKTGKTEELYKISGAFKRTYRGLNMKVSNIEPHNISPKDIQWVSKFEEIKLEETKNDTLIKSNVSILTNIINTITGFFRSSCSDGTKSGECTKTPPKFCSFSNIVDDPKKCGCLKNQRIYENKCVPIIKCSDGTLHPECSTKKGLQCINGTYVANHEECGCPEGYVKSWGTCVKTCKDGTPYNECSDDKPLYCYEGALINKASECGCSSGLSPDGNMCVKKTRAIALKIFEYTNNERRGKGFVELKWSEDLAEIATMHSEDMATNNFFSHVNLNGEDPSARARRAGFHYEKALGDGWYAEGIAENIGKMPTGNVMGAGYVSDTAGGVAAAQTNSWMESKGHRENILNSQYTHLGVGVAYDGQYYVSTQNFW